jgi:hypothetical protein
MKSKNLEIDNSVDIANSIGKAAQYIYAEHPHECNTILYVAGAVMLIIGAYNEYRLI